MSESPNQSLHWQGSGPVHELVSVKARGLRTAVEALRFEGVFRMVLEDGYLEPASRCLWPAHQVGREVFDMQLDWHAFDTDPGLVICGGPPPVRMSLREDMMVAMRCQE